MPGEKPARGQASLLDEEDGYAPGESMTLQQAWTQGGPQASWDYRLPSNRASPKRRSSTSFDAFKGKYGDGGVAERTKSTNWWMPWEAYLKSWSRNKKRAVNGAARGGRADRSACI